MNTIELDASSWATPLDFYQALFTAVGAPWWHGTNINALVDSMIYGEINELDPPYTIKICGAERLPRDVREEIELARDSLAEARRELQARLGTDVEVKIDLNSS